MIHRLTRAKGIMKIEHFACQVADADAVASWYSQHLGFTVKRSGDAGYPMHFLLDQSGEVMIEFYTNPSIETPVYSAMNPLVFHIAFVCDDPETTTTRLCAAGAALVSGPDETATGDKLAMLRDPWGLAIQLCNRAKPML